MLANEFSSEPGDHAAYRIDPLRESTPRAEPGAEPQFASPPRVVDLDGSLVNLPSGNGPHRVARGGQLRGERSSV